MKGSEFLRKLRRLAAERNLAFRQSNHGKGSHSRVYFGKAFTTMKDLNKELGPGLLHQMCKDLGLDPKEL